MSVGEVGANSSGIYSPLQQSGSTGWICPKCGRVWAYYVHECKPCNDEVAAGQESSDTTTGHRSKPIDLTGRTTED